MGFQDLSHHLGKGIRALFTDRHPVLADQPHDFALSHDPVPAFHTLQKHLGVGDEAVYFMKQVHGKEVFVVGSETAANCPSPLGAGDALVTNVPGRVLVTFHGDCVPIYLYDPVHHAIGLIHSGWKGTAVRIVHHTVRQMQERYGTVPGELRALIGPAAGDCCYEVDEPVVEALDRSRVREYLEKTAANHYNLDLKGFNADLLVEMGLPLSSIHRSEDCTICNHRYFSHRRKPGGGLMIAALVLDERRQE